MLKDLLAILWPEYDGPKEIWLPEDVIFSEDRETTTTQQ